MTIIDARNYLYNKYFNNGDFDCVKEIDAIEEATIKRYYIAGFDDHGREIFELRPLNPAYPVMNSQQLKLSVVGVVVEAIKRF